MEDFSDTQLAIISRRITEEMGLCFQKDRWNDLMRGISGAAAELGYTDTATFVNQLLASPIDKKLIEVLARHLTTGETYFFREKQVFSILKDRILPELIRTRAGSGKTIRIWCAGCSTGEEPYSVAILLKQMLLDIKNWNITIRATDINLDALARAQEGVYGEWSFRDTDADLRKTFFSDAGKGRYAILPEIKKMISFAYLNLVSDPFPELLNNTNAMDLIFCRNVMMYFSPEQTESVSRRFHHALLDGGWFITSVTETSLNMAQEFTGVTFPDAMVYRKVPQVQDVAQIKILASRSVTAEPEIQKALPAKIATRKVPPANVTVDVKPSSHQKLSEPVLNLAVAREHYDAGRYTEAAKTCEALPSTETGIGVMILLTRAYANQGRLELAESWCRKAIAADRINAETHYLMASILQELGREEEAEESLKRVLYLDNNCILAHYDLGNIALRRGDATMAGRHFRITEKILAKLPDNAVVPYSEGMNSAKLLQIIRTTITRVGMKA
jgi:chemotaxis protein methyltransferase CheR